MTETITAQDIAYAMKDAPMTHAYLALLMNQGNDLRAAEILREQVQYVKRFRAMLDRNVEHGTEATQ